MPLFDSLSTSQVYRLPKMNSIPTTDDLRYAIAEGQKRIGKTIELPFEHPTNHQFFIVKLVLSVGNKNPPSWTLQRGDGASGVRLWNRGSEDVMMVQNKIKIDSQYAPSEGEPEQAMAAQPMSLQVNIGGGAGDIENPLAPGMPSLPGAPAAQSAIAATNTFYEQSNQQAINAFQAPPQIAPNPADNWMDNLVQPPIFNPNASKTNIPALHPGTAAPVSSSPRPAPALPVDQLPLDDEFTEEVAEPAEVPANRAALPPPIKLDVTLIDRVTALMLDSNTGLYSFAAFVHYLFREQALHKRSNTPYSVVVFEVALRIGYENVALPAVALPAIIERIKNALGEFDVITHLSGGEFATLLPGLDSDGVAEFAQTLHTAVTTEPLVAGNRNESVLAAIGMATLPATCDDPEVLIAAARQAKETAKTLPHPILMFPS